MSIKVTINCDTLAEYLAIIGRDVAGQIDPDVYRRIQDAITEFQQVAPDQPEE